LRFAIVPHLLAVPPLLMPAQVLEPLEGKNHQLTVRVNEDGGSPTSAFRLVVGEAGPSRALLRTLLPHH